MKPLSNIANQIHGQPMFQVLEKVQALERAGRQIIHFELGEPDFNTPANIVESAIAALKKGVTHYTSSFGLHEFRLAAQQATSRSRHFTPDLSQILVTPGANAIIYYTIKCLVSPGEEVLIPNPGFPTYFSATAACGAKAVSIPLREKNGFALMAEDVEARITPQTKLLIINTPSNPTGAVMSEQELRAVYAVAAQHDLYVLSDEIYSRLIYAPNRHFFSVSEIDACRERTIVINGFSKAFAMTGWRLGCALGPSTVIEKMGLLNETIISCVPPFIQSAGIEAIVGDQSKVREMSREYHERSLRLATGLNKLPGVSCTTPAGAIYVFPNISGTGMTADAFSDFAMNEADVAVCPGTSFGEYGEGFVRFSCVNSINNIDRALANLKSALTKRLKGQTR
ncbi:MAG: pyridoxal phosphate-dependent aminotransferase [Kiritimatiellae bacterium]|nr:pyridoxal phosphate-dependent aminotransferase [Kiritimatiellia bacterium]